MDLTRSFLLPGLAAWERLPRQRHALGPHCCPEGTAFRVGIIQRRDSGLSEKHGLFQRFRIRTSCTLHDVGQQDGVDYLVLEYLEGETLEKKLEKGPLPAPEVLKYPIDLADALDKAHRQGIIHRDIKPGNIMVAKSG